MPRTLTRSLLVLAVSPGELRRGRPRHLDQPRQLTRIPPANGAAAPRTAAWFRPAPSKRAAAAIRCAAPVTYGEAVTGNAADGPTHQENVNEIVPYSQSLPSPDGAYWRCKRPDGTPRCFFAPPPGS